MLVGLVLSRVVTGCTLLHTRAVYTAGPGPVTQMFGCRLVPAADSRAEVRG